MLQTRKPGLREGRDSPSVTLSQRVGSDGLENKAFCPQVRFRECLFSPTSAVGCKWRGVFSAPSSEPIATCPAGAGVCVWLEGPFGGKGPQETDHRTLFTRRCTSSHGAPMASVECTVSPGKLWPGSPSFLPSHNLLKSLMALRSILEGFGGRRSGESPRP